MSASSDHDLVEASRRGELAAFGQLVERYQDVVCAVSYSSTGDRALSEDVAQETFVAAWRRLDRVREGSLRAWLCAIARNLGRKARRRMWREQAIETDVQIAADNPFDDLARADSERIVRDALARIPEKYREVLVLFYRENQSVRDVAKTLGIGEDAVAQRLSRGRRYLADGLTELVETSLRGTRPRRDLAAAVLATIVAFAIPSRVDASSLKTKGSTMMKFAIAASVLAAAGATAYLVQHHASAATPTAKAAAPTLHYGAGLARHPALGPTAPVHATVARSATVDDLSMLPSDSDVVVGVDVTRIRNSSLFKLLAAPALAHAPGLHELESECGFDPIAEMSSITVGIKHAGFRADVANGVIVVHGLAKSKVFSCMTKLGSNAELVVIDGDVMTFGGGAEHLALTFIDDTTALLVVGADATKDGIAAVAGRRGTAGSPSYAGLIHEINTDDALWLAIDESSPVLSAINDKIASQTAVQFHGIYGSVDVSDGIVLNAGGRTGSPALVSQLVAEVQHHLDTQQFVQHFDQLDINADGGDVIVSIALSTSQLMQVASAHGL